MTPCSSSSNSQPSRYIAKSLDDRLITVHSSSLKSLCTSSTARIADSLHNMSVADSRLRDSQAAPVSINPASDSAIASVSSQKSPLAMSSCALPCGAHSTSSPTITRTSLSTSTSISISNSTSHQVLADSNPASILAVAPLSSPETSAATPYSSFYFFSLFSSIPAVSSAAYFKLDSVCINANSSPKESSVPKPALILSPMLLPLPQPLLPQHLQHLCISLSSACLRKVETFYEQVINKLTGLLCRADLLPRSFLWPPASRPQAHTATAALTVQ